MICWNMYLGSYVTVITNLSQSDIIQKTTKLQSEIQAADGDASSSEESDAGEARDALLGSEND